MGNWIYTPKGANSVDIGKGYFVNTPNTTDTPEKGSNARLTNQAKDTLPLILTEVGIDFSASGRTLQSRLYRQFIYHNFGAINLTLRGQCRNQKDLGKIAEFTYQSHRLAVADTTLTDGPLVTLEILHGTGAHYIQDSPAGARGNQKGTYSPITVSGHIESFRRRHERFVNAPTYQFVFVVEQWVSGLGISDDKYRARYLKTFAEIVKGRQESFTEDPDTPEQKSQTVGAGNEAARPETAHHWWDFGNLK